MIVRAGLVVAGAATLIWTTHTTLTLTRVGPQTGEIAMLPALAWSALCLVVALILAGASSRPVLSGLAAAVWIITGPASAVIAERAYSQLAMERVTAEVLDVGPVEEGEPVPIALRYPDGATGSGYSVEGASVVEGRTTVIHYRVPIVGETVSVMRDPHGYAATRTADFREGQPEGDSEAWVLVGVGALLLAFTGWGWARALRLRARTVPH